MESIWGLRNPIFLVKSETLVESPLLRRRILSDQFLSNLEHLRTPGECQRKNGRENFGVQHLHMRYVKVSFNFRLHISHPRWVISCAYASKDLRQHTTRWTISFPYRITFVMSLSVATLPKWHHNPRNRPNACVREYIYHGAKHCNDYTSPPGESLMVFPTWHH